MIKSFYDIENESSYLDQVEAVGREVLWVLRLSVLDCLEELFTVFRVERWQPREHLVDNRSKAPPVDGLAVTLA